MKSYWISAIIQNESDVRPWLCTISAGELTLDRAKMAVKIMRNNHNVLSAWIDVFDKNNIKQTVFHECYIDALGYIDKTICDEEMIKDVLELF